MRHIPVLKEQVLQAFELKPGMRVIDATLGDGGHSEGMLDAIRPNGKLLGIDADAEAVLRAKRFLYRYGEQVVLEYGNFRELKHLAEKNGFVPADRILLDLGWSTPQFSERGRGFSFLLDEPLDMRFNAVSHTSGAEDTHGPLTASRILNEYPESELKDIFWLFGEEPMSAEIAAAIVARRSQTVFITTFDLVKIILATYRKKLGTDREIPWIKGGIHPATKVFQALRIAVNDELEALRQALPQAVDILAPGGRLGVITFHSLEDRIVKQYFRHNRGACYRELAKKPIIASAVEVKNNPSSRSAKLRIIEKIK